MVSGEPNAAIEIFLPLTTYFLKKGNIQIAVRNWSQSEKSVVHLGSTGTLSFTVGATREVIPEGFCTGEFVGEFPMKVSYHETESAQVVSGHMRFKLYQSLHLFKSEDLHFSETTPGVGPERIDPGSTNHAAFEVFGEPEHLYRIDLPPALSVAMRRIGSTGGRNDEILIREFFSSFSIGRLNQNGRQRFYVGAVRDALLNSQSPGLYAGCFTVRVTYP
jgi:hypothetical protein